MNAPRRPVATPVVFKLLVVGAAGLALLAAAGFARETLRGRQIAAEVSSLRAEAERLRTRNFEIAALQRSLQNGEFAEREARLKLGLRKEGEQVVVLTKPEPHVAGAVDAAEPERPAWSNPKKWLMYFADKAAFDAYAAGR